MGQLFIKALGKKNKNLVSDNNRMKVILDEC
jgi:hypothetical protein